MPHSLARKAARPCLRLLGGSHSSSAVKSQASWPGFAIASLPRTISTSAGQARRSSAVVAARVEPLDQRLGQGERIASARRLAEHAREQLGLALVLRRTEPCLALEDATQVPGHAHRVLERPLRGSEQLLLEQVGDGLQQLTRGRSVLQGFLLRSGSLRAPLRVARGRAYRGALIGCGPHARESDGGRGSGGGDARQRPLARDRGAERPARRSWWRRPAATAPADDLVPVPEPDAKALAYYRSGNALWAVGQLFGLAFPLVLLATGFSARMRDAGRAHRAALARHRSRLRRLLPRARLGRLPPARLLRRLPPAARLRPVGPALRQVASRHACSTSASRRWSAWSWRSVCMRGSARRPRRWWLGATACLIPFLLLVFLIEPLWIAPLYNDFGPMKDPALEAQILGLAERAGHRGQPRLRGREERRHARP